VIPEPAGPRYVLTVSWATAFLNASARHRSGSGMEAVSSVSLTGLQCVFTPPFALGSVGDFGSLVGWVGFGIVGCLAGTEPGMYCTC
jgi:hypothetical protein